MGLSVFDDDDIMDWVYELEHTRDLGFLHDTLDAVLDSETDELTSSVCLPAIGAAEVVATLAGSPPEELPDEIERWIKRKPDPDDDLREKARSTVQTIMEGPVMREIWEDADDREEWSDALDDLLSRLE